MNLCRPAFIVLILSILGTICDIFYFGFIVSSLLENIIFTIMIVLITNWSCYKIGYKWISWMIVIINLLLLLLFFYLIKNKNTEIGKLLINSVTDQ